MRGESWGVRGGVGVLISLGLGREGGVDKPEVVSLGLRIHFQQGASQKVDNWKLIFRERLEKKHYFREIIQPKN